MRNVPSAVVIVLCVMLVDVLVIFIAAPPIRAPVGSLTVPATAPLLDCARTIAVAVGCHWISMVSKRAITIGPLLLRKCFIIYLLMFMLLNERWSLVYATGITFAFSVMRQASQALRLGRAMAINPVMLIFRAPRHPG